MSKEIFHHSTTLLFTTYYRIFIFCSFDPLLTDVVAMFMHTIVTNTTNKANVKKKRLLCWKMLLKWIYDYLLVFFCLKIAKTNEKLFLEFVLNVFRGSSRITKTFLIFNWPLPTKEKNISPKRFLVFGNIAFHYVLLHLYFFVE